MPSKDRSPIRIPDFATEREMKTPTLWSKREKKFKPINKQAALITRKAAPWFLPVTSEKPVFALTAKQRAEKESEDRRARLENLASTPEHQKWLKAIARQKMQMKRARVKPKRRSRR